MGAFGIPDEALQELTGKKQSDVIDHLYAELDKCSEGDINTVRTILISLLAASLVGLPPEGVTTELQRVINLLKLEKVVELYDAGS